MKKSVEELMKSRYKVVADYPGMPFLSNQIIEREGTNGTDDYYHPFNNKNICLNRYPHLFKKLEWWEERKLEDMPEYVKVNTEKSSLFIGHIHRVHMWQLNEAGNIFCRLVSDMPKSLADMYRYSPSVFIPATEEEYNNYISSHFVNV